MEAYYSEYTLPIMMNMTGSANGVAHGFLVDGVDIMTMHASAPDAASPPDSVDQMQDPLWRMYHVVATRDDERGTTTPQACCNLCGDLLAVNDSRSALHQHVKQQHPRVLEVLADMDGSSTTGTLTDPLLHNLVLAPSRAYKVLFTKMRDVRTSSEEFVKYSRRAMRLLAEDALAELPATPTITPTPCGTYVGKELSMSCSGVCAVSIVRSGDCLLEQVREIEPACRVGKILIQRDETHPDKVAHLLYAKLPPDIQTMHVLLCDPMLATGGSALKALDVLCNQYKVDPNRFIFANMICCPEGLRAVALLYPMVKIVTAAIDECLNGEKFIVPGLGDYGDRFFNTQGHG